MRVIDRRQTDDSLATARNVTLTFNADELVVGSQWGGVVKPRDRQWRRTT